MTHLATLLPDGRVLVVGGSSVDFDDGRVALSKAEVWDPATSTFSPAGSLPVDDHFSATALADGRVLIFNDENPTEDGYSGSAVVWDPVTDTVSPAGSRGLIAPDSTTLLADGRVLVIGRPPNCAGPFDCPSLAEIWDPATSTFSPAGLLPGASRERYTATALADGGALIAGGCSDEHGCVDYFDSAEVWDPDTETFDPTGSLSLTRHQHTATALPDGRVLVVGGWGFVEPDVGDDFSHASAEVWEPGDG